ncbi:YoaK family protein [Vibrio gallicus]|uniref:YoaK family protein n=1 Tax=Vibrio gallicus TaxID=190897 RepID=UPI0021C26C00|nr:YoaK family protein [Vibrio gallicus]
MITKLPRWVEFGALLLAFIAGSINAIGLLGLDHQSVSHVSGTATLFGTQLLTSWSTSLHLAGVMLSFFLGSAISGFVLRSSSLKLKRHYEIPLLLESALLLATICLLYKHSNFGDFSAAAACGLQNAMVTTYSGAVVRTTHLTGIITDLGLMFGNYLRGEAINKRKLMLFSYITFGFISGGTVGAYLFKVGSFNALFLPTALCVSIAFYYRTYIKTHPEVE